ncbi:MAG: hypothetical protein F6K28_41175 [Microcoleus sp. SIO2G3]|nr:hypothetical protein [Microcoleus sp. SIO2G3]
MHRDVPKLKRGQVVEAVRLAERITCCHSGGLPGLKMAIAITAPKAGAER